MNKSLLVVGAAIVVTACAAPMKKGCQEVAYGLTHCNVYAEMRPEEGNTRIDGYAFVKRADGKVESKHVGTTTGEGMGKAVVKNVLPTVISTVGGVAVGLDRNDAIRDASERQFQSVQYASDRSLMATEAAAAASITATKIIAEREPTKVYNIEDNRTLVDTDVGVGVDVTTSGSSGCSGGCYQPPSVSLQ